jgi:hypothetical protein
LKHVHGLFSIYEQSFHALPMLLEACLLTARKIASLRSMRPFRQSQKPDDDEKESNRRKGR